MATKTEHTGLSLVGRTQTDGGDCPSSKFRESAEELQVLLELGNRDRLAERVCWLRSCADFIEHDEAASEEMQSELRGVQGRLHEAESLAASDCVTGLANRREVEKLMVHRIQADRPFCILQFDLQNFKQVNDWHGHGVGDHLLKAFSNRLTSFGRTTFCRWGGKKFLVVISRMQFLPSIRHEFDNNSCLLRLMFQRTNSMRNRVLFNSFWQAGFECSTHILKTGKRLDLVASTGHDQFADKDFARLQEVGMRTAREGLRWHLIESRPGQYDFTSAQRILEAAGRQDIQLIWDLLHFGWPSGLEIFSPSWVESFGDFAFAFARTLGQELPEPAFISPINEISFLSWAGGDTAYLNPFAAGRGGELKRQLVRGAVRASEALRTELPAVRLVSPEPVIHITGDPSDPDDVRHAAQYCSAMFEAWDMLAGRVQPELGGREDYLDIIGVNYYDRNQWWNFGETIWRHDPAYRPFREILGEVYQRYKRPIVISETGTEDEDRPKWLAYIGDEVRAASQAGVDLHGICLYPILNHPGWDDDRHCRNGLWDYPGPSGERERFEPLAKELLRLQDYERM